MLSNTHGMACIQAFIHQFYEKNAVYNLMNCPSILFPAAAVAQVAAKLAHVRWSCQVSLHHSVFQTQSRALVLALIKMPLCKYKCNNISVYLCDWQQADTVRLSAYAGTM